MSRRIINDTEILRIRHLWQAGLTLSETFKLMNKKGFNNKPKLIAEWQKMKKLFGCRSATLDYVEGYSNDNKVRPITYSEAELNQKISNIAGGCTYGEWKGITGPGKLLKDIISRT